MAPTRDTSGCQRMVRAGAAGNWAKLPDEVDTVSVGTSSVDMHKDRLTQRGLRPQPKATGYRLQATGHRSQATGYRLQAAGYRLQVLWSRAANSSHGEDLELCWISAHEPAL